MKTPDKVPMQTLAEYDRAWTYFQQLVALWCRGIRPGGRASCWQGACVFAARDKKNGKL